MAETPIPKLHFASGGLPARREVELPRPLPTLGDDFDWHLRDFDGFRRFMLEELAARFPQRRRWTSSDLEVVIVEALAAVLDQISDKADRVAAEHLLETARRPESVRRLLSFIGYDAMREAGVLPVGPASEQVELRQIAELERRWARDPELMHAARRAGPRSVHQQRRMVNLDDYGRLLEQHPLVRRAKALRVWRVNWTRIRIAVVAIREMSVDATIIPSPELLDFHKRHGLRLLGKTPRIRTVLEHYIDSLRMVGHEVELFDPCYVPLELGFRVVVEPRYFRSEVELAVRQALSTGPGGFFEHGRLDFGQSIHESDLRGPLMRLEGVVDVEVTRFERADGAPQKQLFRFADLEIAVCDNQVERPGSGRYELILEGGRTG